MQTMYSYSSLAEFGAISFASSSRIILHTHRLQSHKNDHDKPNPNKGMQYHNVSSEQAYKLASIDFIYCSVSTKFSTKFLVL